MASFAEKAAKLSKEQIDLYADLWEKLVEENAALRVLIDNRVINTSEDFFDNAILSFISKEPKSQVSVISDFLGKWYCADFSLFQSVLNTLLKSAKLKLSKIKQIIKEVLLLERLKSNKTNFD